MSTIPKIIHYCWFGHNPLPKSAIKCIHSWKKYFPDYEIREWNEDNFDVNIIPYTREAYEAKKYAFVSDYARFWILYHYGGVYFDTDVEVINSFDDIIENGPFMGVESVVDGNDFPYVNPGLGISAIPKMLFYEEMLSFYDRLSFLNEDGTLNSTTIVIHTSSKLKGKGLQISDRPQIVDNIWIYPQDYFNPFNSVTGQIKKTSNTRSIHWYSKTWVGYQSSFATWFLRRIHRYFGTNSLSGIKKLLKKMHIGI